MLAVIGLMDSWEKLCVIVPTMLTLFWAVKGWVKKKRDTAAAKREVDFKNRISEVLTSLQAESKPNGGVHRKPNGKVEGTLKDLAAETNKLTADQMQMLHDILEHQKADKEWRETVKRDLGDTNLAFAHLVVHISRGSLGDSRLLKASKEMVEKDIARSDAVNSEMAKMLHAPASE